MEKSMKKISVLILLSFAFTYHDAVAGEKAGNGGGAFICPDPSQSEFLDLYEAREGGLLISPSSESLEDQIRSALSKLRLADKTFKDIFKTYEAVRAARIIPLPENKELAWPSDALNKYAKAG